MLTRRARAVGPIRSIVRSFGERRAVLGGEIVTTPLPARPDQFVEIYLADRYRVSHDDLPASAAPEMVVVGPQSYRRTRLFISGDVNVFTIRFEPGGFHALFGIAMTELTDQGAAAGDVIGAAAAELREAVLGAPDFDGRAAAAERWIAVRMDHARPPDAVARLASLLARSGGRLRVDALARQAGLSDRQFSRRFSAQVGLPPKLYARTIRFNAVLDAKEASPRASWTELVHAAGYADQAHFIRDSHALAGAAPTGFFAEWSERHVADDGFVQLPLAGRC